MNAAGVNAVSLNVRGANAFSDFEHQWQARLGDRFSLPAFSPATIAGFRVQSHTIRVQDVAFTRIASRSAIQTAGGFAAVEDHARLWIVQRGAWLLGDERRGVEQAIPAGRLVVHLGRLSHFAAEPGTVAQVLVLPAATLGPQLRGRTLAGPAGTAEVRLLVAHAGVVRRALGGLGPAGLHAVRETLVELARAVALGQLDEVEPQLAPALAQAARDLADRWLTESALSPPMLARTLNVSLRALQRAFAAEGESVASYIRQRRLEQARSALAAPERRMSISEVAAQWQFADSSHFGRAFRHRYGQSPSDYVRAVVGERPK